MKLTTNFAPPVRDLVIALVVGSVAIAIVSLAVGVWLITDGVSMRAETTILRQRAGELEKKIAGLPADRLPAQSDLISVRGRVATINELSGMRGWPLPVLLERVGSWLPDDAYLVRVVTRSTVSEVEMTVEADKPETLLQFLDRLQKESHFSEVLLTRQSRKDGRGDKRVQFELRLKERPE